MNDQPKKVPVSILDVRTGVCVRAGIWTTDDPLCKAGASERRVIGRCLPVGVQAIGPHAKSPRQILAEQGAEIVALNGRVTTLEKMLRAALESPARPLQGPNKAPESSVPPPP